MGSNYDQQPEHLMQAGGMLLCSLYDCVAKTHQSLFHQPTLAAAIRAAQAVTKAMRQNDFRLINWGEWYERAAKAPIQMYLQPRTFMLNGTELEQKDIAAGALEPEWAGDVDMGKKNV